MKGIYVKYISAALGVKDWQVENCVTLLDEGATVPFISRYRKERTGGLDEVEIASVKHYKGVFDEMEKRKETIIETISALGKLTPELKASIEECVESRVLEDIYLPYRPKRRTRASVAREAGREPLADRMAG
ncbi:MAG: RNA-binding transcriptional accessory protein, partial [Bacteroidales bacterium]|nr:RNA-binding transcriptional accessory protein [Bacteroidales bacterium]